MEFIKTLIENAAKIEEEAALTEEWHEAEHVSTQVGDYRISAIGYFDETELVIGLTNTKEGKQYRAEVFKDGNGFEVHMYEREGSRNRPMPEGELNDFLTQLTQTFVQQNYDSILTPPEGDSDEYDNYYNRRERMRQARDYRAEIEADY